MLDVSGRLIKQQAAVDALLDHEEATVSLCDGCYGDIRLPAHVADCNGPKLESEWSARPTRAASAPARRPQAVLGGARVPDLIEFLQVDTRDRGIIDVSHSVPGVRTHAVDDRAIIGDEIARGTLRA